MALITFTSNGLYCRQADAYVDPWKPVERAIITHAHSDHARSGHKHYLCTKGTEPILRLRLGEGIQAQAEEFGSKVIMNGVKVSFHPAGHLLGSAQVRLEYKGEIWVISGDYKVRKDRLSEHFEPVKCQHFVTESTFGLPVYQWQHEDIVADKVNTCWKNSVADGKVPVIGAYALGKAQRILSLLNTEIGPVYTHGAVENVNQAFRENGVRLKDTIPVSDVKDKTDFLGGIVIATPSAFGSSWMKRFGTYTSAFASGWMMLRGTRRRMSVDQGFVISDHADWAGLNSAIEATGAENIYVTHGYTSIFSQWLREKGLNASEVKTEFEVETLEQQ
jgi:putative mRNA 3-end processing factor